MTVIERIGQIGSFAPSEPCPSMLNTTTYKRRPRRSGMDAQPRPMPAWQCIALVIHQALVEVSEQGAECAE